MPEQEYPEPIAGALILNKKGEILLMKSHKWKDKYMMPGGHIELGEGSKEALKREIKEETSLEIHDIELLCVQEYVYGDEFWEDRHFIFLDHICKTDQKEVKLNREAEDYVWVKPEEALELPVEPYTKKAINEYLGR